MKIWKIVLLSILGLVLLIGLSFAMGWVGVGYIKTVGKAKQDAKTEVFENSNAFIKGKRQEILKAYKEYHSTDNETAKKAIAYTLSMSLADFDEDQYIDDLKLKAWVKKIKY